MIIRILNRQFRTFQRPACLYATLNRQTELIRGDLMPHRNQRLRLNRLNAEIDKILHTRFRFHPLKRNSHLGRGLRLKIKW